MATVTIEINNQTSQELKVHSASTTGKWQVVHQGYIEAGDSATFEAYGGDQLQGRIILAPNRGAGNYRVAFETVDHDVRTSTRVPPGHTQEVATTGAWPDFGLLVVFK